ncbi:MAG TPA: hypothetical protein VK669_07910 [Candidatus Limnocylindrales bacterium]|nr:hypothetical protein [Candidatus Limnocylindrales bacterium]
MSFLADQLSDYPRVHADRKNLLIHALAVPVFDVATVGVAASLVVRAPLAALGCAVVAAGAFAAQGRGHGIEAERPIPFAGPGNALARIFAEQFITFPRFVLSGGWAKAYEAAGGLAEECPPATYDRSAGTNER